MPTPQRTQEEKDALYSKDAQLCTYIDNSLEIIEAGLILNKIKDNKEVDLNDETVQKVLSAKRVLDYLRSRGYNNDFDIMNIGDISILLMENNNNFEKVSLLGKYNIEEVKSVKNIMDDYSRYKASVKERGSTIESANDVSKLCEELEAEECETDEQKKMLHKICAHKDFGKRNPVDIGIDRGYSEDEVLRMLRKFEGK